MKKVRKGYRKARVKRPVEKDLVKGYDSNWEYELHQGILDDWEHHVDKCVRSPGFKPIPGWESLYFHCKYKVVLSVYVDDFKIGGATAHLQTMIDKLRKLIHLDEANPLQEDVTLDSHNATSQSL